MKIPCTLMLKGQSDFVDILSQKLKKHVNKPEIVLKETFFFSSISPTNHLMR